MPGEIDMLQYRFLDLPRGGPVDEMAMVWQQDIRPRVVHILIPSPHESVRQRLRHYPGAVAGHDAQIDGLCHQICRYLAGEVVELAIDLLDVSLCTPFQWRVLMAEKSIPRGEVRAYGRVAQMAGRPGGARAAGNALGRNPFPIVIPCHRAVRSDGSLGGYLGGLPMKRALLELEGVRFDARGRVIL
jgi:methylated-DNA-[protein]-cysteine S-methyltransferase